jgi:hypothetical protein
VEKAVDDLRARKKKRRNPVLLQNQNVKYMITEKSIFTLEIPEWINKVRVGTVPTLYYTKGEALQSMKELRYKKIGAKQYYGFKKHKKNSKNPLQKGNPEY